VAVAIGNVQLRRAVHEDRPDRQRVRRVPRRAGGHEDRAAERTVMIPDIAMPDMAQRAAQRRQAIRPPDQRYWRQGQTGGRLALVLAGSIIRVEPLPGPGVFDLVVAAVLIPLALAATTLLGLGLFAAYGWWEPDSVAALAVVYFAICEGREAWHGELICAD
jgi:hypothetical protein